MVTKTEPKVDSVRVGPLINDKRLLLGLDRLGGSPRVLGGLRGSASGLGRLGSLGLGRGGVELSDTLGIDIGGGRGRHGAGGGRVNVVEIHRR